MSRLLQKTGNPFHFAGLLFKNNLCMAHAFSFNFSSLYKDVSVFEEVGGNGSSTIY